MQKVSSYTKLSQKLDVKVKSKKSSKHVGSTFKKLMSKDQMPKQIASSSYAILFM